METSDDLGYYCRETHDITISPENTYVHLAMLHEMGHMLDQEGIENPRPPGRISPFASVQAPVMSNWRAVVDSSHRVQSYDAEIESLRQRSLGRPLSRWELEQLAYLTFLRSDQELWARAYTQYIATRTTDVDIQSAWLAYQDIDAALTFPEQWHDRDYDPIAQAIDSLFLELGWIQNAGN